VASLKSGDRLNTGAIGRPKDVLAPDAGALADDRDGDDREQLLAEGDHPRPVVDRQPSADYDAASRLASAEQHDVVAETRDVAALARDQAAEARDRAMTAGDEAEVRADRVRGRTGADVILGAAQQRRRAARHRLAAAEERALAAEDRIAAADDREQAARDRRRSFVDREMFVRRVGRAETDSLTGARTRAAGLADLDHELDRCRAAGGLLILTCVDVVGLRALEDSDGQGACDEALARIVRTMRDHLRSYDLIIRHRGEDFLCAMPDLPMADARERFCTIADALADAPRPGRIRTGFAQFAAADSAAKLIARADRELIDSRHG
jgi:diguanylate cyclase (GGDEF)-like protein